MIVVKILFHHSKDGSIKSFQVLIYSILYTDPTFVFHTNRTTSQICKWLRHCVQEWRFAKQVSLIGIQSIITQLSTRWEIFLIWSLILIYPCTDTAFFMKSESKNSGQSTCFSGSGSDVNFAETKLNDSGLFILD